MPVIQSCPFRCRRQFHSRLPTFSQPSSPGCPECTTPVSLQLTSLYSSSLSPRPFVSLHWLLTCTNTQPAFLTQLSLSPRPFPHLTSHPLGRQQTAERCSPSHQRRKKKKSSFQFPILPFRPSPALQTGS